MALDFCVEDGVGQRQKKIIPTLLLVDVAHLGKFGFLLGFEFTPASRTVTLGND